MNILGIETSCDETAAAIVKDGRQVLANVVATSLKDHQKYGGIIPEIASRRQLELITAVTERCLADAKIALKNIRAIAVTQEPGLIGSLLVGLSFARALAFALKKPLLPMHHIQTHLYSAFLQPKQNPPAKLPKLPVMGLIVSGGHTSLYLIRNFKKFELLGQTRDDAAGEAFDKVARILNLGYPGGPVIDKLAKQGSRTNLRFACAEIADSFDFSFSGIKTAVLYHTQKLDRNKIPKAEIAYAFQRSVVDTLTRRAIAACKQLRVKSLVVGGGVAANSALRETLTANAQKEGIAVFFPPMAWCIDNAAMVAGLAFWRAKR